MKILFLTAGAAGMYCGSCMHDNALAREFLRMGVDCLLQPVYTPIRTDEPAIASKQVFFGGVQIYLLQKFPLFRYVPGPIRRLLDRPAFLSWATRGAGSTDPTSLGDLAVSMLRGEHGNQRAEVERLVTWLRDDIQPDVIILSNLLIGGCLPAIRRAIPATKIIVILQGDDSFLDHLPAAAQSDAIAELTQLSRLCDAIVVNSDFYGKKMTKLLDLPAEKVRCLPLSIDTAPFINRPPRAARFPITIGYLARLAPEKGFHRLVDAFIELAHRTGCEEVKLCAAGWLGKHNEGYFMQQEAKIRRAGLEDRFAYQGSPSLTEKVAFLDGVDILSVPTEHEEPKGLFLLEAMASGVPVVQPARGAFPELIESTGGGILISDDSISSLADGLQRLVLDADLRLSLGESGRRRVMQSHTTNSTALALLQIIEPLND